METQKCFKVLKHIGMIQDENIRKRTGRTSSEWLKKFRGTKIWGDDFQKSKMVYYLKVMGSLK